MSNYIFILDAGHGGLIDGVPQTAGKRSPEWDKGVLYEGVINRKIVAEVDRLCKTKNILTKILVPEAEDVSLGTRVRRVENLKGSKILLSIHCDAFTTETANGWSAFTTRGETKSDFVAEVLYKHAKKSKFKLRTDLSDGDSDKEADFFILRKTSCPAVLIENFFMTNKKDYSFLMSDSGIKKIGKTIFNAILEINGK